MESQTARVLQVVFGSLGAISALAGASFQLASSSQSLRGRSRTKATYARRWEAIRDTGLLSLPQTAIGWLLDGTSRFTSFITGIVRRLPGCLFMPYLLGVPILGIIGLWIQTDWRWASAFGGFLFLTVAGLILVEQERIRELPRVVLVFLSPLILLSWVGRFTWLATVVIWLRIVLSLETGHALILMLGLFPVYATFLSYCLFMCGLVIADVHERLSTKDESVILVGIAVSASPLVTVLALTIGKAAAPSAWIPQNLQMCLSNLAFDGLTVLVTFRLLRWAVEVPSRVSIPIVVVLDATLASLFACASLWAGLAGTEHALGAKEVAFALLGRSTDGVSWELGPIFWAMHTTLIPTLLYLSVIGFCWIGKTLVLPIASILRKGREVESPHGLTAATFYLIAAISGVLVWAIQCFLV